LFPDESSSALAITATTGIAAINIGGVTLHSWAGIKLGDEPVKNFIGKVLHQPVFELVLKRWRKVDTLIIDESELLSRFGGIYNNGFVQFP
jgi:ATP-dependent DNA helicase PIF1